MQPLTLVALVRAIGQLMNPEMINGKVNNLTNMDSDQMAMSALGRDLTKAIHSLDWYRKRSRRLSGEDLREFQEGFDIALRTDDEVERRNAYSSLNMNARDIEQSEMFRKSMFDPKTGFAVRLANHMVDAGIISASQRKCFC